MNRLAFAAVTGIALAFAATADTYITEKPEDTSMIKVGAGTTTVGGAGVFEHMFVHMAFDPNQAMNYNSVPGGPTLSFVNSQYLSLTNDEERGESVFTGESGAFKLTSENLDPRIPTDMTKPFTAAFWVKVTAKCSQPSSRMFYLGPTDHVATEGESIDCFWGNDKTRTELRFCGGTDSAYKFSESQIDKWLHLALVCTPTNVTEGARLNVGLFANGRRVKGKNIANFTNVASNVSLWVGRAAQSASANYTFYNHIMMFDIALTTNEVAFLMEHTAPLDFSAGWDIDKDGTLVVEGGEPLTALVGEGVCRSVQPLTLAASLNAVFAGRVDAPSLTFAGAQSSVTQELTGVSAVTAPLTVSSGTLTVHPLVAELKNAFGENLVAYYSFDDAANPGKDLSGRGNDLVPNTSSPPDYAITDAAAELPFATSGGVITFDKPEGATTHLGFSSKGKILDGFDSAADNSFAVSAWARYDAVHNSDGIWVFGGTTQLRAHKGSITGNYYGDNGSMNNKSFGTRQLGEWHHYVLFYDATGANGYYFREFIDGVLYSSGASRNAGINHAADVFRVGTSNKDTTSSWFTGAMDEVIVLNRCDTNDVARLYNFRRALIPAPTGTLGSSVRATVGTGATLSFASANETISGLYGVGNLYLDEFSILRVTDKYRFKGQVLGGGQLIVDPAAEPKGLLLFVK